MIALNGSFLGIDYFINGQLPQISKYNKITFYGNSNIDKIWIQNKELVDSEINSFIINNYLPIWNDDTSLYAEFDGDINAGWLRHITTPIQKWIVNRKEKGSSKYTKLKELNFNTFNYNDYKVQNNKEYEYQITAMTQTELSEPLQSDSMISEYSGWFLINEEDNKAYKLFLNVQSGSITSETDVAEYQTYGKYNAFSQGKRNYIKGTISAVIPEEIAAITLAQSPEFIKEFQDDINNGKSKILKSPKGDIWRVMTSGFQRNQLNDGLDEQIDNISFSFVECGEA